MSSPLIELDVPAPAKDAVAPRTAQRKIILVGNPNVGKSVIFRLLTGSYVLVSNFPGTTVEISRGRLQLGGVSYEVIDTPGIHSCVPQSEDERVTCEMLLRESPDIIIQVADAKNLRRTLLITSQLAEFGIPMILVLNMMDEAEERGITIDVDGLARLFSAPVVETVAIYSRGRKKLLQSIQEARSPLNPIRMPAILPAAALENQNGSRVPAALAAEWIGLNDPNFNREMEASLGNQTVRALREACEAHRAAGSRSLQAEIAAKRNHFLDETVDRIRHRRETVYADASAAYSRLWLGLLLAGLVLMVWNEIGSLFGAWTPFGAVYGATVSALDHLPGPAIVRDLLAGDPEATRYRYGLGPEVVHLLMFVLPVMLPLAVLLARNRGFTHELGILTRRPSTGIPILLLVLVLVYEFVGYTGAQSLVGLLEKTLFGKYMVPALRSVIPHGIVYDLLLGQYGLISMGLTYALAIVLPVVATFFVAFGLLEDSGYLPRLSILSDRVMRSMGLNGKATLPMVLGLGCCTMATMTTRILNSPKERLIATLLLALGIPCSAQLGVILGMSAAFSYKATLVVVGVVLSQLFLVGFLASRLVKGRCSEFIFEIPPIRVPQLRNVLLKTGYRIRWYLWEAVPLFLYGTLALYVLDRVHVGGNSLMAWIEHGLEPLITGVLHLPPQAAGVFVLGFLRRDYGAAGLFDLSSKGMLTGQQAVVSLIVITLFVPCLASFLVIVKEHGVRKAIAITGFIVPFAVAVGGTVGWILRTFNWQF
jgi:ferrous iron transport protein B